MGKNKTRTDVKRAVHARDKVCQLCGTSGSKNNRLTVHHIKPKCKYPKLVNEMSNLILLCEMCHRDVHRNGFNTIFIQ